ncbi:protein phosphatase 1K, mitochondrial isoform X1 [Gadus macrocephalus]|uniref:protein phosphatase 1K, mitochondrial isoform X1 n=1 Tax=Gadus macrocephalus TaxID=80720 RepID=UPI0028CB71DD|nr:protein phosphatase 1K, mitochondrial isoform X1 [Gadus macrocephalus]XP_059933263.1 protein phosphatase 1K, mitochondrial isoform X1 [Gadus macrocephalus]
MSRSALLQVVFRGRSGLSHQTHLRPRPLLESPPTPQQQQVCVRWASCAARLSVDWDSLGIWDRRQEDPLLLPSSVGPQSTQVSLSWVGSASVLGRRKHNEDRLRVGRLHDDLLYLAVFDGHGGVHAADYCCTHLDTHLRKALEEEEDLEKVVTQAFLNLDRALHRHLSNYGNTSHQTAGTTATVAMLRAGTELVVGSVGDSRALLCRRGRAHKLTQDHTPDRRDERDRIKSCGGFVAWNSVGVAYVDGRLAMTRSIGDFHLKHHGVIPTPETTRVTVNQDHDSFLALTTDGINFLLSDQEICDVIKQSHNPTESAELVTQQALQYGTEDNSSILILPLGAWSSLPSLHLYSMSRNLVSCGRWA